MATITLTIPDSIITRVITGLCGYYRYPETVSDPANPDVTIPNPETRSAFAQRMVLWRVKRDVLRWEAEQAHKEALATGEAEINL